MEPWQEALAAGQPHRAWDLFAERYRRLILATIRRVVPVHDDVMDVFAMVCQALSADGCARLGRYSEQSARRASVATWTVVVVRNLAVDWLRHEEGRRRVAIPAVLSPLQQAIYRALCVDRATAGEAYELIVGGTDSTLSFAEFLRETRATLAIAPCPPDPPARHPAHDRLSADVAAPTFDPAELDDLARRMRDALASQPSDVRLAVELFVIEGVAAADVARVVGWPNAKTVYNRVHRALAVLRTLLVRQGIGPGDL